MAGSSLWVSLISSGQQEVRRAQTIAADAADHDEEEEDADDGDGGDDDGGESRVP